MTYDQLLPVASTDTQRALVRQLIAHPQQSIGKAGRVVGMSRGAATSTIGRLRKRLAKVDPTLHSPGVDGRVSAEGYALKGVSTLTTNTRGETCWVKTSKEAESAQQVLAAFQAALESSDIRVKAKPVKAPKHTLDDLLLTIPMGDPHIGMIAWGAESGADHDTEKSAAQLRAAVDLLIEATPNAGTAILMNLGDMFHSDNKAGVTSRSGNSLDVDPRWARVAEVVIDTMVYLIDRLLAKHSLVVVDNRIGNHDDAQSWMLSQCLKHHYRNEPRADIVCEPGMYWHYEFGVNLLMSTHGHGAKPGMLPGVMLADWPEAVGRTKHRLWYTGHIHHETRKEFAGCSVESFRTLAPKDAWSAGQGHRAEQSICGDVWHRQHGKLSRHYIDIKRVLDLDL